MRLALSFLFNFLVELKKTKSPLLFANEGEKSEKRELKSSSLLTTYRVGFFQSDRVINHEDLISGFVLLGESYSVHPDELAPKKSRFYQIRTITELEAVEFRAAMEAVYG